MIIPSNADSETLSALAQEAHEEWEGLRAEAYDEMKDEGFSRDQIELDFGMQARYMGNIEDIEVNLSMDGLESIDDLQTALDEFENRYEVLYSEGAKYSESGFYVSEFFVKAVADKPDPVLETYDDLEEEPTDEASKGTREAYYNGEWQPFDIYDMRELKAGNQIGGPAIIEDPMTTLVIPPTDRIELDEYRFIHYKEK
jgi:N-methylhydantoinase A